MCALLSRPAMCFAFESPSGSSTACSRGLRLKPNCTCSRAGCSEIDRTLLFRDWLRSNAADRDLYARTKLELAQREWEHIQNYADAKTAIVAEIIERAR